MERDRVCKARQSFVVALTEEVFEVSILAG